VIAGAQKLVAKLAVAAAVAIPLLTWKHFFPASGPPEITPFKAPKLKQLAEFGGKYQDDMFWGTYRSGLYFGMKTRYA
jgi:mannosyl-oligosaccharide glucosidase